MKRESSAGGRGSHRKGRMDGNVRRDSECSFRGESEAVSGMSGGNKTHLQNIFRSTFALCQRERFSTRLKAIYFQGVCKRPKSWRC